MWVSVLWPTKLNADDEKASDKDETEWQYMYVEFEWPRDKIETRTRSFQSVRDETGCTFSEIEWSLNENERENL